VTDQRSDFVRRLPIGERLPIGDLIQDELFPLDGDITVKPLDAPRLPEPPRAGEPGGDPCPSCNQDLKWLAWDDEHWSVLINAEPHGLPMVAVLQTKAHHDLDDLPPDLAAELGPMIQRVARAVGQIDSVGRVHVNRWGDGSEHFHIWFLGRPKGMWQMRGAMLAVWDDILPKVPVDEWTRNRKVVVAAMASHEA
jgi:diadenosine tetraphosphate (Ap4A) HIT family hydrolase